MLWKSNLLCLQEQKTPRRGGGWGGGLRGMWIGEISKVPFRFFRYKDNTMLTASQAINLKINARVFFKS